MRAASGPQSLAVMARSLNHLVAGYDNWHVLDPICTAAIIAALKILIVHMDGVATTTERAVVTINGNEFLLRHQLSHRSTVTSMDPPSAYLRNWCHRPCVKIRWVTVFLLE